MDAMNKVEDTKVNWQPAQPKMKKSKLMRIITTPIRILTGARNMYVKSMNNYAETTPYAGTGSIGGGAGQQPLPRSFSATSTRSNESDDLVELIRAVSTRDYENKFDIYSVVPPSTITTPAISRSRSVRNTIGSGEISGPPVGSKVIRASSTGRLMKPPMVSGGGMRVPRSASVRMGKIDEDKAIEKFEDEIEDSKLKKKNKKSKKDKPRKESTLFPRGRRYAYPGTTTETTPPSTAAVMF